MEVKEAIRKARLYGILDLSYVEPAQAPGVTTRMLEGGVQIVQLRAKGKPESIITAAGRALAPLCRSYGVPFLLNDHPRLVAEVGADGAHIGQDDQTLAEARRLMPEGAITGKSTHTIPQALEAHREGADYIGFGPLFATPTKPEYAPIGTTALNEAHRCVPLPIFCIGGIKRENLPALLADGARRVVIVSGILQARDIVAYCHDCRTLLDAIPLP